MKCVALLSFISLSSHRTVRIGSGTKNFLTKLKSRTQTLDKSLSVENVGPGQENGNTKLSGDQKEGSEDNGVQEKPSTWSEHVWSTFIHRGYSDDVTEKQPLLNGKVNLLPSIGEQNLITRFILGFADELPTR